MLNGVQFFGTNFSKRCCGRWVQQGLGKFTGGLHGVISGGSFWHRTLVREELDGLGCAFGVGILNVDLVASVVFGRGTNVPVVYTMWCPGAVIAWGSKHQDSCSWRGEGAFN